jgi:hypothetical protein
MRKHPGGIALQIAIDLDGEAKKSFNPQPQARDADAGMRGQKNVVGKKSSLGGS